MPTTKLNSDFWVQGLRQQLKITSGVGSAYRISQQSGKCKLDIQYSDKSRKTAITPIEWKQENARVIENAVIKIAKFVAAGKTLKEAVAVTFGGNTEAPEPTEDTAIVDLIDSFNYFCKFKVSNGVKQSTIDGIYKKYKAKLEYGLSNNEVNNAQRLLQLLSTVQMPNSKPELHKGTRTRQQVIGAVCTWLEWATELEENEAGNLNPKFWTPPKKGSNKKKQLTGTHKRTRIPIPIYDDEFLELLEILSKKREKKAADRYIFLIQLINVYGIRAFEADFLEVQNISGKDTVFCLINKTTGGGESPENRELYPLHKHWETEFELIEKIKNNYPIPPKGDKGLGDALGKHLAKVDYWKHLRDTRKLKPYSMRHGYAYRMHQDPRYKNKISSRMGAALMGHDHSIHLSIYGKWTPQGNMRNTLDDLLA